MSGKHRAARATPRSTSTQKGPAPTVSGRVRRYGDAQGDPPCAPAPPVVRTTVGANCWFLALPCGTVASPVRRTAGLFPRDRWSRNARAGVPQLYTRVCNLSRPIRGQNDRPRALVERYRAATFAAMPSSENGTAEAESALLHRDDLHSLYQPLPRRDTLVLRCAK